MLTKAELTIAMQTLQMELNQCQQAREELETEHKKAAEALHKLQEELEFRVQQRTAELTQANQALQENLERYQVFVATTSEGIWCFELAMPIPIHLPLEEQIDLIYRHAELAECNDVFAHTYGYKQAKEITGARLPHFTPDKFQNRVTSVLLLAPATASLTAKHAKKTGTAVSTSSSII